MKYYYYNKIYQDNLYTDVNIGKLSYGWSEYLGHYYINNFQFELGGKIIDNYDSDQLHIFQSHNISKTSLNTEQESRKNFAAKILEKASEIYDKINPVVE